VCRVGVERVEVVFDEFDLRTLGDLEAEPEEDILDLAACLGDEMKVPVGQRRRARQGYV